MSVSSVQSAPPLGPRTISNQQQRRQGGATPSTRVPASGSSFEQELSAVDPDKTRKGTANQRPAGEQSSGRKVDLSA